MSMDGKDKVCPISQCNAKFSYKNIAWWALLCIAVLVVPSIAIMFTTAAQISGLSEIVIFIAVCWMCVFLGLRLMKTPRMTGLMFERITVSEQARQRCINMVSIIEAETAKWKKRYEKCEPVFMSLAKKPAWDYLDEIVALLSHIKQTVEKDSMVDFPDISKLNSWVGSAKPAVLEGYLHTLEATYGYAKAEYAQQGKNIEEIYPELAKGQMSTALNAPAYANTYARELLDTLKQEHPVLAHSHMLQPAVAKVA